METFKYLIIPRWLYDATIRNSRGLADLLNLKTMSSLLSVVELTFYIRCNLTNYSNYRNMTPSYRLFSKLGEPECRNFIALSKEFLEYNGKFEKIHTGDPIMGLFYNPVYSPKKKTMVLDFKPILVGENVLGLVAIYGNHEMYEPEYSLRRDIYDVMRKYQSVDNIIHSPIFGA